MTFITIAGLLAVLCFVVWALTDKGSPRGSSYDIWTRGNKSSEAIITMLGLVLMLGLTYFFSFLAQNDREMGRAVLPLCLALVTWSTITASVYVISRGVLKFFLIRGQRTSIYTQGWKSTEAILSMGILTNLILSPFFVAFASGDYLSEFVVPLELSFIRMTYVLSIVYIVSRTARKVALAGK